MGGQIRFWGWTVVGLTLVVVPSWAQEVEKAEPLPAPRLILPPAPSPVAVPHGNLLMPLVTPSLPPQPRTSEVWQLYGVDSTGHYRPRVVLSPYGSYYLYNGQPFPWTTTRPNSYLNKIAN